MEGRVEVTPPGNPSLHPRKGSDRALWRGHCTMAGLVRIERTTGRLEGGCSIH